MKRTKPMDRTTPMRRTGFAPATPKVKPLPEILRTASLTRPRSRRLKSTQRPVSAVERALWDRMAVHVGCIACRIDGRQNDYVSIHHIDGRTKPGCHRKVLPLCAGHHQHGTGADKTLIAVHPHKSRFEARYGSQAELLVHVIELLGEKHA